jgi:hypothetical protein
MNQSGISVVQARTSIKSINVALEGLTPLLVNRFHEDAQLEASSGVHSRKERLTPEDDAKERLYWNDEIGCYLPAENLRQSIIAAGSRHKIGRKGASGDLAAALYIEPFALPLAGDWHVDTRPVVIPATRGRVLRHRPMFDHWRLELTLRVDAQLVDLGLVRMVVDDAGNYEGVGDFRPARKGPYGRFMVVRWELC